MHLLNVIRSRSFPCLWPYQTQESLEIPKNNSLRWDSNPRSSGSWIEPRTTGLPSHTSDFPFKIAQPSLEDTSSKSEQHRYQSDIMVEPSASQDTLDMDSAAQLRKERNKIACRKSRKKRYEKLKRLQVQTEELEFKQLALRRRLIELQKSTPRATHQIRGTFEYLH